MQSPNSDESKSSIYWKLNRFCRVGLRVVVLAVICNLFCIIGDSVWMSLKFVTPLDHHADLTLKFIRWTLLKSLISSEDKIIKIWKKSLNASVLIGDLCILIINRF